MYYMHYVLSLYGKEQYGYSANVLFYIILFIYIQKIRSHTWEEPAVVSLVAAPGGLLKTRQQPQRSCLVRNHASKIDDVNAVLALPEMKS